MRKPHFEDTRGQGPLDGCPSLEAPGSGRDGAVITWPWPSLSNLSKGHPSGAILPGYAEWLSSQTSPEKQDTSLDPEEGWAATQVTGTKDLPGPHTPTSPGQPSAGSRMQRRGPCPSVPARGSQPACCVMVGCTQPASLPRSQPTSRHSQAPFTTHWGPDGSRGPEGVTYEFVMEPRQCGGVSSERYSQGSTEALSS